MFNLLGIRQGGKAVDSESIMHWFESSMPNLSRCDLGVTSFFVIFVNFVTFLLHECYNKDNKRGGWG